MAYIRLSDYVYDCQQCHTRCDGVSKGVYHFAHDVSFSEHFEQLIIEKINQSTRYHACKCEIAGFPDIEIRDAAQQPCKYVEVKVQQRAFMQVQKHLPAAQLTPSETVALNESDLLRYFAIAKEINIPVVIVWVLLNRNCIVPAGKHQFYFQDIVQLEKVYRTYNHLRRFRRKSGDGDVVDGVHKGVTVNYHFSLKELKRWEWERSGKTAV